MCLIVFRRNENEKFSYEDFLIAVENNPDGTGIMYPKDGRIIHRKFGKPTDQQNKEIYDEFMANPKAAIHVRIKTHGDVSDTNAHPFKLLDKDKDGLDLYMMHNGTVDAPEVDSSLSDTWHFVNLILRPMLKHRPYTLVNPATQHVLKKIMGHSRLLFMYGDGTHVILDSGQGKDSAEHGGVWLSNGYSLNKRYSYNRSGTTTPSNTGYPNYGAAYNKQDKYDDDDWYGKWSKGDDERLYDRGIADKSTSTEKDSTSKTKAVESDDDTSVLSSEAKRLASYKSPIYEEEGWWEEGVYQTYADAYPNNAAEAELKKNPENGLVVLNSVEDTETEVDYNKMFAEASSLDDILETIHYMTETDIDNLCHENPAKARDIFYEIRERFEQEYDLNADEDDELTDAPFDPLPNSTGNNYFL